MTLAYNFDSRLLMGSQRGLANIERFNKVSTVEPGAYRVDVYINDGFVSRQSIEFQAADNGEVLPCLSDEFLSSAGVLVQDAKAAKGASALPGEDGAGQDGADTPAEPQPAAESRGESHCAPLSQRVPGASTAFDMSGLRLNISVPQAQMKFVPRGAVDPSDLDAGDTVAYANYDTNYYTSSGYGTQNHSVYAGISAGFNIGLWRLRQQSSYSYFGGAGGNGRLNIIRTYAERPLAKWKSQLTVGESYTGGSLLSSVGYTGIRIETDERMLPDSLRGYAPVINGVANTNARVVVSQNGNIIHQTTVAPGPFSINDLNATSYQGDLNVEVIEANGQVSRFTVPFSAVPDSMRPGASRYSVTVGQVRQVEGSRAVFADLTYQRGLTNLLTANTAARVSSDYQSVLGGLVFGTRAGAFGFNAAWSNALDEKGKRVNGWMSSLSYSHTFQQTLTTFSLAGYRYSTKGYRDFVDALAAREAYRNGQNWSSSSYQRRDQFTVNVNQSFNKYGSLSLSAASNRYYGGRSRDTQLQLSYSNSYKSIGYNLSFIRQKTGAFPGAGVPSLTGGPPASQGNTTSNVIMLTASIPLGTGPRSATVASSVSRDSDNRTTYQAAVSGVADEARTLTYGLNVTGQSRGSARTISANLQKSLPVVTVGANASHGKNYWQIGASARGAAVAHRGGVTLGPYLSDTFGIVEAKGAEGATVRNSMGARVDRAGFAIVPSLSPYRYTDVALDTKGINRNAELVGNQVRVAPYAGAAVHLKFSTLTGHALLIEATQPAGGALPLGADVLDNTGASVGIVGQGGLAYARAPSDRGELTVKWGERHEDQCRIQYVAPAHDAKTVITRVKADCLPLRIASDDTAPR